MKLWPSANVRPIRFHHLGHTTASLLLMRGADLPAVQKILRHSDPRMTTETYGHLVPDYLRAQIDRLTFGPAATSGASNEKQPLAKIPPPFAPILLPTASDPPNGLDPPSPDPQSLRDFESGRGERIRTSDILLPKQARYQAALRPELCLRKPTVYITDEWGLGAEAARAGWRWPAPERARETQRRGATGGSSRPG
jgi:Phage integrase family